MTISAGRSDLVLRDVRPWPREPGGDAVDVLVADRATHTLGRTCWSRRCSPAPTWSMAWTPARSTTSR